MRKIVPTFALALAATAAGAQTDREAAALERHRAKYAQSFSLEGEPRQLCADEITALIASQKSREEGAATVERMIAKMDRFVDQERNALVELQVSGQMQENSGQPAHPVTRFYHCYLKVRVLRDIPVDAGKSVGLPAVPGNRSAPIATPGAFRRTAASSWQYISSEDSLKALVDQQQDKNRARTGKTFSPQEALAACAADLKAADALQLARKEKLLAEDKERLRQAKEKGDSSANRYAGRVKSQEIDIVWFRTRGYGSYQSHFRLAEFGAMPIAELRREIAGWEPVARDPSHSNHEHALSSVCVMKLRLAQLEAKPSKK